MNAPPPKPESSGRDTVLAAVRRALGRDTATAAEREAVAHRLANPNRNLIPARGREEGEPLVAQFIAEAERVNAVVRRIDTWDAIPATVAGFLRDANLPLQLKLAPDPMITAIPWSREPMLSFSTGDAEADDQVGVTSAYAGVGETGTLILLSAPDRPVSLNFLPEVHVVVLPTPWIVGTYEDAWESIRAGDGPEVLPRVVNWITGPSRTADIEQTLLLGAHGPKQLLIVLVDAEARPPHP